MTSVAKERKTTFEAALALVAGAMMIAGGITTILLLHAFQSYMFGGGYMMGGGWRMFMSPVHIQYMVYTTSIISMAIGAVVLALGYKIRSNPQATRDYGIMILVASLVGLFTASGFGMGAIIGIIAGIVAIARK